MRTLSEKMFDAAQIPDTIRKEYWKEFGKTKAALRKLPSKTLEAHMQGSPDILTVEQMEELYESFYFERIPLRLNRNNVPRKFWPLLHYAAFWGNPADSLDLAEKAPLGIRLNLKRVTDAIDADDIDEWLAGPEAKAKRPSVEYIAYSAMRIAGYTADAREMH